MTEFKEKFFSSIVLQQKQIRLFYQGRQLNNNLVIDYLTIPHNAILHAQISDQRNSEQHNANHAGSQILIENIYLNEDEQQYNMGFEKLKDMFNVSDQDILLQRVAFHTKEIITRSKPLNLEKLVEREEKWLQAHEDRVNSL